MRSIMAVVMLIPLAARAQDQQVNGERPYWETCKQVWTRAPYLHVDHALYIPNGISLPSGGGGSGGTGSSGGSGGSLSGLGSGGGGGGGAGYVILVLAVVALAVLPVVIYAIDDDADPLTLDRFYCPEFSFSANGGVRVPSQAGEAITALGLVKFRADVGYVGGMVETALQPAGGTLAPSGAAHFLVRVKPKKHLEGALAIGARRALGPGGTLDGFEVALPHMYVFNRDGYKKLGLEVMPRIFWNPRAIDAGADLTMVIPLVDVLQLRVGAGAYSHIGRVQFTASAGLTAHL